MITRASVAIDAPSDVVWEVYSAVEQWSEWTSSIERIVALDGAGIEVGHRFAIKQPRLPNLVWEVTAVEPGVSWTWRQRSPGGTSIASHEVVADAADRTIVRQSIDQRGPVGVVVGVLMRRLTRRYLELESKGLKARTEFVRASRHPVVDGPTA